MSSKFFIAPSFSVISVPPQRVEDAGKIRQVYACGQSTQNLAKPGMESGAFWEPHFAAEFASESAWRCPTHRLGAKLHPLTIEQNALTSFKSRYTLVPATANTIGPGLFLKSDKVVGGCDGIFGRGMQWQGVSLKVTLQYGPDIWVPSSFMPTLPGRLFFMEELAGSLIAECN